MDSKQDDRLTRTVPEAARLIGVGPRAVYELARLNQLRTIKVGRKILVPLSSIAAFINGTEVR